MTIETDAKKQGLLTQLSDLVKWALTYFSKPEGVEQALSMPNIYNFVQYALDEMGNPGMEGDGMYRRLIDCYMDGSEMYAVVGMEGKLYKSPLILVPGGVKIGDMQEVEIDYKLVSSSNQFRIMQQADGKYRWFACPAATAVLNKNGYVNSRKLYDSFIQNLENNGYPYLTFYHIGESLKLGVADFVARDGYCLLVSGTFDDNPLAQQLASKADIFDGVSIGFDPTDIQQMQVGDGIEIPVHTAGILRECSALISTDAACLLTGFTVSTKGEKQSMDATVQKNLLALAKGNPDAEAMAAQIIAEVDQTNQVIVNDDMVRQQAQATTQETDPAVTPPVAPVTADPEAEEEAPEGGQEIILTDEALEAISQGVAGKLEARFTTQETALASLKQETSQSIASFQSQMDALKAQVESLGQSDEDKVAQALEDMPRNTIVVGFRPSKQVQGTKPEIEEPDLESVAKSTLSKIKAGAKKK
jgi:hypothetical protein